MTFWGFWDEQVGPTRELGQAFWWDAVSRDAGFGPFMSGITEVIAGSSTFSFVLSMNDGGPAVSVVRADGGMGFVQAWPGQFHDCRMRGDADRLWCTTSDQTALLAVESDGGTRLIHAGGIDTLWLARTVGDANPVLFFANSAPDRGIRLDAGSRIFATRAEWPSAIILSTRQTATEFAVQDLGGGVVRFGEWTQPDGGGAYLLTPADYCFPSTGP